MRWNVLTVTCDPAATEAVSAALMEFGCQGVVMQGTDPVRVQGSVPAHEEREERLIALQDHLQRLPEFGLPPLREPLTLHQANDEDWAEAWKVHFKPAKYGKRLVIKPTWEDYTPEANELILELDPGMAFGTGAHPTTRLCMLALEERVTPGMRVADIGTGSGVLAIAAARLGAAEVLATDIESIPRRVAHENVCQNRLEQTVHILEMDAFEREAQNCDLIAANIVAQVILELAPTIAARLKLGGLAILSGIVEEYHDAIVQGMEAVGFTYLETTREDIWVCIVAQKVSESAIEALPEPLSRANYPWAV